jgi:hypothetical protein
MKIITNHRFGDAALPVGKVRGPFRHHDWCAYLEGREERGPYGWGRTEAEAVNDLNAILEDDEQDI